MDDKTKRIEELEARAAELAAEIAALKAEKPAPKFKKGDTAYLKGTITEDRDGDCEYRFSFDTPRGVTSAWTKEEYFLPAAPALVPVVPGELKPGDEVYVKAKFHSIDSDGDIWYTRHCIGALSHTLRTGDSASIPANVYQVR